jgi:hypothetical protein
LLPVRQSLSSWHDVAHVAEHAPLQQIGVDVPAQSDDVVHDVGHGVADGLRHKPAAMMVGSSAFAFAQHDSPAAVLQLESERHAVGQLLGAVQIGVP